MELLASLPGPSCFAAMTDLVNDHGFDDQAEVRRVLKAAHVHFIGCFKDGQRVIYVDALDWECMQPRIRDYWRGEYGE